MSSSSATSSAKGGDLVDNSGSTNWILVAGVAVAALAIAWLLFRRK